MAILRRSLILILHPDDERVFSLDGQSLPSFSTTSLDVDMNQWNCMVQELLDLPFQVVFLRRECGVPVPEGDSHSFIFIFEIPHTEVPRIGHKGTWIAKERVSELCKDPPTHLVTEYLRKYAVHGLSINADRLLSFSKRGWFDATTAWCRNILVSAGFKLEGLQQHVIGNASCLLLARSQCGVKFYVKGCYPTGIYNEAAVTLVLGTAMPDDFTRPLAADLERNVLLMNDLGPMICSNNEQESEAEVYKRMCTAWGEVQLRSIAKKEQLVKGGLPVWDMEMFQRLSEEMFGDAEWWSYQQESMDEEARSKYDWATCKELFLGHADSFYDKIARYRVPFSLVHGDLNDGNVLVQEDSKLAFIDFSCAVWSFPFFDLFLSDLEDADEAEFYLKLWSEYESMDRLKQLFELTLGFREFFGHLKLYHVFKYAEQSEADHAREELPPVCELFEEE